MTNEEMLSFSLAHQPFSDDADPALSQESFDGMTDLVESLNEEVLRCELTSDATSIDGGLAVPLFRMLGESNFYGRRDMLIAFAP